MILLEGLVIVGGFLVIVGLIAIGVIVLVNMVDDCRRKFK